MKQFSICLLCFALLNSISASEFINGNIKLVINEKTGGFSVYYDDTGKADFHLFLPERSLISVLLNDQEHKLGSSRAFKTRLGGRQSQPAIVFESENLTVNAVFSFIRTVSSSVNNGLSITFNLKNTGSETVKAGLKIVLYTRKKGRQFLYTDKGLINTETAFDKNSEELWWIAKDDEMSIMGNIAGAFRADEIQIASITNLSKGPWKYGGGQGALPNSSGVGYYFEEVSLNPNQSIDFPIVLAVNDESGFASPAFFNESIPDSLIIKQLTAFLDYYLAKEDVIEDEALDALENMLEKLQLKK